MEQPISTEPVHTTHHAEEDHTCVWKRGYVGLLAVTQQRSRNSEVEYKRMIASLSLELDVARRELDTTNAQLAAVTEELRQRLAATVREDPVAMDILRDFSSRITAFENSGNLTNYMRAAAVSGPPTSDAGPRFDSKWHQYCRFETSEDSRSDLQMNHAERGSDVIGGTTDQFRRRAALAAERLGAEH